MVFALVLSSCALDDDPASINTVGTIEASLPNVVERTADDDTTVYMLEVPLSGTLQKSGKLTYNIDGEQGTVQASEGDSSFMVPVDMTNDFVRTVTIEDLIVLYANSDGNNARISETLTETKVVKGPETLVFTFTWGDDSDLDCGTIQRGLGGIAGINLSQGVTNTEICVLPGDVPNGLYQFAVLPWTVNNDPIECYVEVINGLTISNYTGNLTGAQPAGFFGYNTIEDFLELNKTGTGTPDFVATVTQVLF